MPTSCRWCAQTIPRPWSRHMSPAHTRIQCPGTWAPWDRMDPKAIRRGSTYIRFMPLPVYAYVVADPGMGFQIIQVFTPYVTCPKHPHAIDAVFSRIDPLAWVSHES